MSLLAFVVLDGRGDYGFGCFDVAPTKHFGTVRLLEVFIMRKVMLDHLFPAFAEVIKGVQPIAVVTVVSGPDNYLMVSFAIVFEVHNPKDFSF
jgi:hypothetical protein